MVHVWREVIVWPITKCNMKENTIFYLVTNGEACISVILPVQYVVNVVRGDGEICYKV